MLMTFELPRHMLVMIFLKLHIIKTKKNNNQGAPLFWC